MLDSLSARGRQLLGSGIVARKLGPGTATTSPAPRPLGWDEFEPVDVDAGRFWMSRRDEVMRPYMSKAGTWEPEEGRLLRSLIRPGERFLDIGANVGYFSVLVGKAAPGVSVDAVEPDPNNVRALEFNLWVNRVQARVWPLALDDTDRSLLLSGHQTNLGDLRCDRVVTGLNGSTPTPQTTESDALRSWVVPPASGNELFAGRAFDLIKVDVQGWEFAVLCRSDRRVGPIARCPDRGRVPTQYPSVATPRPPRSPVVLPTTWVPNSLPNRRSAAGANRCADCRGVRHSGKQRRGQPTSGTMTIPVGPRHSKAEKHASR